MQDIYVNFFNSDNLPRKAFTYGQLPPPDCNGPTLTAVQWLKCFFTPQGSDPLDPDYGTILAGTVGSNVASVEDLGEFAQLAVDQATQQMRRIQGEDLSITSTTRLNNVEILDLALSLTSLMISVRITTQDGQSVAAAFSVPKSA